MSLVKETILIESIPNQFKCGMSDWIGFSVRHISFASRYRAQNAVNCSLFNDECLVVGAFFGQPGCFGPDQYRDRLSGAMAFRGEELEDRVADRSLAAPRLTYQGKNLPLLELETDPLEYRHTVLDHCHPQVPHLHAHFATDATTIARQAARMAGICCTANEILMRHGIPVAGDPVSIRRAKRGQSRRLRG